MKTTYLKKLKSNNIDHSDIQELPREVRGRPLLLGDKIDAEIKDYCMELRKNGGVLNTKILLCAARGIVMFHDKTLLTDFGGHIDLNRSWAISFLNRLGFSRRVGTKAARALPENFDELKRDYLERITNLVTDYNIPDELIINWDQTGINLIPASRWTMEMTGAKQVGITGLNDKRQITAVLAVTLAGEMLPPQILYQGKTDAVHPKYNFPAEWDIFHTPSHWSTAESMSRYIDQVIVPYVMRTRERLDLPLRHPALCTFDVFAAHRDDDVLEKLHSKNIKVVFVPARCTGQLQALDANPSPNRLLKVELEQQFSKYYADKVMEAMREGKSTAEVAVPIQLPVINNYMQNGWCMHIHVLRTVRITSGRHGKTQACWMPLGKPRELPD